jgi:hypothetical protein
VTQDEALARESIRATLAAYNAAGDSGRVDEMVLTFLEEGLLETIDRRLLRGRDEIAGYFRDLADGFSQTGGGPKLLRHHLTTSEITIEGPGQASGRAYVLVVTESGLDHSGLYLDRFERRDGRWLIAHRKLRVDWMVEGSAFRRLLNMR